MTHRIPRRALAFPFAGAADLAYAQTSTATSAVTGQVTSLIIGLLLVLAIIGATAWLLKRLAPATCGSSNLLKVVAGAAVGQRERVVIVEIGTTWLVLGVAPGSVNTLHQMPRIADDGHAPVASAAVAPFVLRLRQFINKRTGNPTDAKP
jgi:flagellar protein FliO/FliZ